MTVDEIMNTLRYAEKTHTQVTLGFTECGMLVAAIDATKKIALLAAQDNKRLRGVIREIKKEVS